MAKIIIIIIIIIINIILCRQHGYPWPSLATPPYHSSFLAGLQGYIPYPHKAAACMFELAVQLLLGQYVGVYRSTSLMSSYNFNIIAWKITLELNSLTRVDMPFNKASKQSTYIKAMQYCENGARCHHMMFHQLINKPIWPNLVNLNSVARVWLIKQSPKPKLYEW